METVPMKCLQMLKNALGDRSVHCSARVFLIFKIAGLHDLYPVGCSIFITPKLQRSARSQWNAIRTDNIRAESKTWRFKE